MHGGERMKTTMLVLTLGMATLFVCTTSQASSPVSVERGYEAMSAINRMNEIDNAAKSERLNAYYRANLAAYQAPASLSGLSSNELAQLFRAAYLAYFYSYQESYLDDMRLDIEALVAKGPLPEELVRHFYASLVTARHFAEAEAFRGRHPLAGMPAMPPVEQSASVHDGGPTVLALKEHDDSRVFQREAARVLGPGSWVLVVSHQLCHFSQNASRAIAADPVLGPVFRDHAQWIAPQESAMALSSLTDWNREHAAMPIAIAYRQSDWPMVSSWATPTFYFFRDGQLVRQVTGWPAEGNREALIGALRENGLLK